MTLQYEDEETLARIWKRRLMMRMLWMRTETLIGEPMNPKQMPAAAAPSVDTSIEKLRDSRVPAG